MEQGKRLFRGYSDTVGANNIYDGCRLLSKDIQCYMGNPR
jgi:hypothetical protein